MAEDLTGKETPLHIPLFKKIDKSLKGMNQKRYLDIHDPFGNKTIINLGDPDKEAALSITSLLDEHPNWEAVGIA